jgi:LDH2 family malate/lactate/ureidoglycolate dehydrogenase
MTEASKYRGVESRVSIEKLVLRQIVEGVLASKGCSADVGRDVADHLIESDDSGVESHGVWRIIQYAGYYDTGYMDAGTRPELKQNTKGAWLVDGHNSIGIPAMTLATDHVVKEAKTKGVAAIALQHVGHTGRLGAFAEQAANESCLLIIVGGGGRKNWRLVAPYGGAKALLPTNPYAIGIPGGNRGPMVLDFATSAAAAGWVYSARIAGAQLAEGILIDKDGNPSTDPESYFDGGAILTAGGAKGYALAVAAEMIAEAMLGPATTECNWLMIALDCGLYQEASTMQSIAEEILVELRECPPAPGFDKVEVPGERERDRRAENADRPILLPAGTWAEIMKLATDAGIEIPTHLVA